MNNGQKLIEQMTYGEFSKRLANSKCTLCNGDASSFKDKASAIEYTTSGLCQNCQDEVLDRELELKGCYQNQKE